jgi:uncharacterized protein (TIGR03086 family)
MTEIAERFRRVAATMTHTIAAVPAESWRAPSPCAGWVAHDVVAHLVDWLPGPGFLLGAYGVETEPIPPVGSDPAGAWAVVRDAIQAGLEDPVVAERVEDCGPPGRLSFAAAVELTCLPDVLIHTWDLAQATGVVIRLDAAEVARQVAGVDTLPPAVDDAMRSSGHFGPRVEVPGGAGDLERLLAFYGRRC